MRNVPFSIVFDLLNEKKIHFKLGKIFIFISIFIFLVVGFINFISSGSNRDYDVDTILEKGTFVTATISNIRVVENVTINDKHPVEIFYYYNSQDKYFEDSFQTLDLEKVYNLSSGDSINIKTYKGQSVILGMESFSFPTIVFLILPFTFLIIGLILLVNCFIPALKKYNLFKKGVVTDAYFIAFSIVSSSYSINQRIANIDYYYIHNDTKVFGNTITKDFLGLIDKNKNDLIKIFVNPNNPLESCTIPLKLVSRLAWHIN